MTDRELLQAAAKAAGLPVEFDEGNINGYWPCGRDDAGDVIDYWSPLLDDGDAMRLAVKLRLEVDVLSNRTSVNGNLVDVGYHEILHGADPYAATRRAIVRAAAAIGEGMK